MLEVSEAWASSNQHGLKFILESTRLLHLEFGRHERDAVLVPVVYDTGLVPRKSQINRFLKRVWLVQSGCTVSNAQLLRWSLLREGLG